METEKSFHVSRFVVLFYRGRAVLFVAAGVYLVWLVTAGGQVLFDIHRMPWSYIILTPFVTFAPTFLAWITWRRVPWGASGGLIRIGVASFVYSVGPDHIRRNWSDIAAVHPVSMPRHTDLLAVWLPVRRDTGMVVPSEADLRRILHKGAYRPVVRPDGLLLPIELFTTAGSRKIFEALASHVNATEQPEARTSTR